MALRYLLNRMPDTAKRALLRSYASGKPVVEGPSGSSDRGDGGHRLFKNIALFGALPVILIVIAKCYTERWSVEAPRPPFVAYEFLRRRTKRFPWGDGTKSLFHNERMNALPEGYEDGWVDDGECDDE